jgi:hypothetical protein
MHYTKDNYKWYISYLIILYHIYVKSTYLRSNSRAGSIQNMLVVIPGEFRTCIWVYINNLLYLTFARLLCSSAAFVVSYWSWKKLLLKPIGSTIYLSDFILMIWPTEVSWRA